MSTLPFDIFLGLLTFGHSLLGYHSKTCASLHDFEHLGLHFLCVELSTLFLGEAIFTLLDHLGTWNSNIVVFFVHGDLQHQTFLNHQTNVIKNIEFFFFGFHGDLE